MLLKFFLIILLIVSTSIFASESEYKTNIPPPIGNFSLPQSQQPGPFFSFGQNLIGKGDLQLFVYPFFSKFNHASSTVVAPSLLYGLTERDSILLTVPVATNQNNYQQNSRGLLDTNIQFEHEVYNFMDSNHYEFLSLFFGIFTPTGSVSKAPILGSGDTDFFIGGTYNQTFIKGLWFISGGTILSPFRKIPAPDYQTYDIKLGNFYTASIGGGYNLYSITDGMELFGLIEFSGNLNQKDKLNGIIDDNSGGYSFLATPSLWFSTKRLIFQLGLVLPMDQYLNGAQNNFNYTLLANVGYTFYY